MRIALAQINTTVGDIAGNLELIRERYALACEHGAELVLFPELTLTGYPPCDLLEQSDFIRANLDALKKLARESGDAGLVVGYAEPNPAKTGKPLFNAAALLHKKKIAAKRFKTLIPSYDVFDETRYFEPADNNIPISFRGRKIGLTICEDAWNDKNFRPRQIYKQDPVDEQVKAGAEILINIAASPFDRGKVALRRKLIKSHAVRAKRPFIYCSLVGGNDELIFDGSSFALDPDGHLLLQAKSFAEDLLYVDSDAGVPENRWDDPVEIEHVARALILGIRDYTRKCGFADVIVGLSGGIDSAVVCALAADALGPEHVTGVSMPSMHSSKGSVADAEALAETLGVNLYQIPITHVYNSMLMALREAFRDSEPGLAEQNIQARVRGSLLMALSNKSGGLVLSTGNKSELSVGYCTLYGDMNGGLAVIADLPKTAVYQLAAWLNRDGMRIPQATIDKPPSAELKPEQKDQDDLPPYDVLDDILTAYVEQGLDVSAIVKRGHAAELVGKILGMIDRNEYKRRQAPPALRVSGKAFGAGRRMPMARGSHR
ncbi:MAG: NAD+ synthase [Elusimicrobiota bacterium]